MTDSKAAGTRISQAMVKTSAGFSINFAPVKFFKFLFFWKCFTNSSISIPFSLYK